jgi:hypothetical protein
MSKFTFTQVYEDQVTTKEFETDYLFDVVERFEEFLRGCGFYFHGRLDIVNDDIDSTELPDESFQVSFSSPIFESPDGGKTIYSRNFGSSEKKLHSKN